LIAVIIPDRGDRKLMTSNCLRMMAEQTIQPTIFLMDEKPKSELPDITYRYRKGYEQTKDFELVFFIETDDWYHPNYLYTMYSCWLSEGKPDIIGIDYTYYYHIKLRKYFKYGHVGRASMMNTAMKPGLDFKWPNDNFRFVDMYLWDKIKGLTISPEHPISIGIKGHGEGMTGGTGHNNKLFRYVNDDNGFLERHLDKESFYFYDQFNSSVTR